MNEFKEFLLEYLRIITNTILGLIFAFASFYLILNYYHYTEVRRTFNKGNDDTSYSLLVKKTNELESIISKYNYNNYKGNYSRKTIDKLNTNIKNCISNIKSSSLYQLTGNRHINVKDIYVISNNFEKTIINDCLVLELNWLIDENNKEVENGYLKNIRPYAKSIIISTSRNMTSIKNQILNNSSYYFNTNTASATIWDINRNGYQTLIDSSVDILDLLSTLANYIESGDINE